jgi:very-short-patch-repair endonuclease
MIMGPNNNPTTLLARELRQTANPAEQALWSVLRGRQLGGYKFTRQYPVGPYFADFACREKWLLIEVNGSQHIDCEYDRRRDAFLLDEGYSVYRMPSTTVLRERETVCSSILAALEGRLEDFVQASDLQFVSAFTEARKVMRRKLFVRAQTGQ